MELCTWVMLSPNIHSVLPLMKGLQVATWNERFIATFLNLPYSPPLAMMRIDPQQLPQPLPQP